VERLCVPYGTCGLSMPGSGNRVTTRVAVQSLIRCGGDTDTTGAYRWCNHWKVGVRPRGNRQGVAGRALGVAPFCGLDGAAGRRQVQQAVSQQKVDSAAGSISRNRIAGENAIFFGVGNSHMSRGVCLPAVLN